MVYTPADRSSRELGQRRERDPTRHSAEGASRDEQRRTKWTAERPHEHAPGRNWWARTRADERSADVAGFRKSGFDRRQAAQRREGDRCQTTRAAPRERAPPPPGVNSQLESCNVIVAPPHRHAWVCRLPATGRGKIERDATGGGRDTQNWCGEPLVARLRTVRTQRDDQLGLRQQCSSNWSSRLGPREPLPAATNAR